MQGIKANKKAITILLLIILAIAGAQTVFAQTIGEQQEYNPAGINEYEKISSPVETTLSSNTILAENSTDANQPAAEDINVDIQGISVGDIWLNTGLPADKSAAPGQALSINARASLIAPTGASTAYIKMWVTGPNGYECQLSWKSFNASCLSGTCGRDVGFSYIVPSNAGTGWYSLHADSWFNCSGSTADGTCKSAGSFSCSNITAAAKNLDNAFQVKPPCTNECSSGQTGCSTSTQRWYCGEAGDGDNCLDKIYSNCGSNQTCSNGQCANQNCTPHASYSCYSNDVYWFNSCGAQEEIKQDCGDSYCGSWGSNYCKNGNLYHSRSCNNKGCTGNTCYSNNNTEEELAQTCPNGCESGECKNCTTHFSYKCANGDLYWFDSCGTQEELKEDCRLACDPIYATCDNGCKGNFSVQAKHWWGGAAGNAAIKYQNGSTGTWNYAGQTDSQGLLNFSDIQPGNCARTYTINAVTTEGTDCGNKTAYPNKEGDTDTIMFSCPLSITLNGLKISASTNKAEYTQGENITLNTHVTNWAGNPVQGATMGVILPNGSKATAPQTDSSGNSAYNFTASGTGSQKITIIASKAGYYQASVEARCAVKVTQKTKVSVIGSNGKPVQGASVYLNDTLMGKTASNGVVGVAAVLGQKIMVIAPDNIGCGEKEVSSNLVTFLCNFFVYSSNSRAPDGDPIFCSASNKCGIGEGDCDSDLECKEGLKCSLDEGTKYGLFEWVDVCELFDKGCHNGKPDEQAYCTAECKCNIGEGPCRNDSECINGLVCTQNYAQYYGYDTNIAVCQPPKTKAIIPLEAFSAEPGGNSVQWDSNKIHAQMFMYVDKKMLEFFPANFGLLNLVWGAPLSGGQYRVEFTSHEEAHFNCKNRPDLKGVPVPHVGVVVYQNTGLKPSGDPSFKNGLIFDLHIGKDPQNPMCAVVYESVSKSDCKTMCRQPRDIIKNPTPFSYPLKTQEFDSVLDEGIEKMGLSDIYWDRFLSLLRGVFFALTSSASQLVCFSGWGAAACSIVGG